MAAYQAKFETLGLLVYPEANQDEHPTYTYDVGESSNASRGRLLTAQLPVSQDGSYSTYTGNLTTSLGPKLSELLRPELGISSF
jgi:hypothetical protein